MLGPVSLCCFAGRGEGTSEGVGSSSESMLLQDQTPCTARMMVSKISVQDYRAEGATCGIAQGMKDVEGG